MDSLSTTKILTLKADPLPEKVAKIQWGNLNFQIPLYHHASRPASFGLSLAVNKRKAPVVVQLEGRNGATYYSGFSDVMQPTIEYERWQDLESEEIYFIGARNDLKEKTTLKWDDLQSVTNMHIQSYPGTLVTYSGERIIENHLTVAKVKVCFNPSHYFIPAVKNQEGFTRYTSSILTTKVCLLIAH